MLMRGSDMAAARSATSSASAGVVYMREIDLAPVEAGAAAHQDLALLLLGHGAAPRLGGLAWCADRSSRDWAWRRPRRAGSG